jgi:hypothetical protein
VKTRLQPPRSLGEERRVRVRAWRRSVLSSSSRTIIWRSCIGATSGPGRCEQGEGVARPTKNAQPGPNIGRPKNAFPRRRSQRLIIRVAGLKMSRAIATPIDYEICCSGNRANGRDIQSLGRFQTHT